MGLFDPAITFTLTPAEARVVLRPVIGGGGAQHLMRDLLQGYNSTTRTGTVDDDQLLKALRYAYAHGAGGFQQRFRAILAACERAGWVSPPQPAQKPATKGAWNAQD